jgi:hypothetical protein
MTPTVAPADALARLFAAPGPFTADGFDYCLGASSNHGPDDVPFAIRIADGAEFCATGEPGTAVTDADTWVLV